MIGELQRFDELLMRTVADGHPPHSVPYVFGPMGSGKSSAAIRLQSALAARTLPGLTIMGGRKKRTEIRCRNGTSRPAIPIADVDRVERSWAEGACAVVDEAQFLEAPQLEFLRDLSVDRHGVVAFFGLRTDSRGAPFTAVRNLELGCPRLLLLALPHDIRCWCGLPAVGDRVDSAGLGNGRHLSVCLNHQRWRVS